MLNMVTKQKCRVVDANLLAADMHALFFRERQMVATPKMLGSLMFLGNHLEHYPQALEYAEMLHKRAPESVVSLQFQLYLTALLELPEKRALVVEEMVERRDAGQLSRQEIFNLELFLQE